MLKFEFLEDTHTYTLDGVVIPSVTQVLPYNYGNNAEYARQKGIYVHDMLDLYGRGNLDEESLDPILKDYLESYKLITNLRSGNVIADWKTGIKHPANALQLAGYHLLVTEGVTGAGDNLVALSRAGAFQGQEVRLYHPIYRFAGTIDYVYLSGEGTIALKAIYLKGNGKFPPQDDFTKDYRQNKNIFLSFLISFQWRQEKGLSL